MREGQDLTGGCRRENAAEQREPEKRSVALGFFDGVHPAHRAVLAAACKAAREGGMTAAALTLDRHPASALTGEPPELVQTLADRVETLKAEGGVEEVIVLPFDRELRQMDWQVFADTLTERYRVGFAAVGYDYRFGRDARGTPALLRERLGERGIPCEILPRMDTAAGVPYGSTELRRLLKQGEAEAAAVLMGRPFAFSGEVLHGKGLGHTLGFPTMNVPVPEELVLPAPGVYVSRVTLGGRTYGGVTNVAPTRLSETYVFDYEGNAYGKTLRVRLLTYRRPMRDWRGWEALAAQVARDKLDARTWLSARGL